MNENELRETTQNLMDDAKGILVKKGEIVARFFVFAEKEDKAVIVDIPVGHLKNKAMWAYALKCAVEELHGQAAFMVAESYISTKKIGDPELEKYTSGEIAPSQDPNHVEAIIIHGKTKTGLTGSAICEFKKDSRGNVTFSDNVYDSKEMDNRFFKDLWPTQSPTH